MSAVKLMGLLKSFWPFLKELFFESEDGKVDKKAARRFLLLIVLFLLIFTDIRDSVLNYVSGRDPWMRPGEYRPLGNRDPYLDYLHRKTVEDERERETLNVQLSEIRFDLRQCVMEADFKDITIESLNARIEELQNQITELRVSEETYRRLIQLDQRGID